MTVSLFTLKDSPLSFKSKVSTSLERYVPFTPCATAFPAEREARPSAASEVIAPRSSHGTYSFRYRNVQQIFH